MQATPFSRRSFLGTAGALGALGSVSFSHRPIFGEDVVVTPEIVRLRPEIEPLVRLIEETPREKCLEMAGEQLRGGLPYRRFLAALFLAGIRNVNPQPPGFKFHCVFAIHAAHLLALDAAPGDRLLPLMWALDEFKSSQQRDIDEGDFRLPPPVEPTISPSVAMNEFTTAMDTWDEAKADAAITSLFRSRGANEVIEALWRYGARDYRNIGHKAIFVANAWRTLQTIGWRHAEPVLRSMTLGLLDFGRDKKVDEFSFVDQSYAANLELVASQAPPDDWSSPGTIDEAATLELVAALRGCSALEASQLTLEAIRSGKLKAAGVWDAIHLSAGELMMRQPGIYGIHAVTSANALRYAFGQSSRQDTRLVLLLQGLGWICQFRHLMASKAALADVRIDALTLADIGDDDDATIERVLASVTARVAEAAPLAQEFARRRFSRTMARSANRGNRAWPRPRSTICREAM